MLTNKKYFLAIIIMGVAVKFLLFAFTAIYAPQSKFQNDSSDYLNTAMTLVKHGVFAKDNDGVLRFESFRTPGYSLFLAFLHGIMKIPLDGVILMQLLLTILAAFITYRAAFEIDKKIAFLSGVIVLYCLPITVFSLQILTETLYLCFMSLFMLAFIRYLKGRETKSVILSAAILALATYVRPISYYLCAATAVFIVYANIRDGFRKAIFHAVIFLAVAYGLLGIWQIRNYIHFQQFIFTSITEMNYRGNSIFHSYATNKDPFSQGLAPIPYYINVTWRCFLSLMTRPGTLKYFHCHPLTIAGKVFAYPFVIFWCAGFLIGLTKIKRNVYHQFILFTILYFIFATIAFLMWSSSERYRVPVMPFIAVISAAGWIKIKDALWPKTRSPTDK